MHVLLTAMSRFTQLTGICRNAVNHAKAVADIFGVRITLVVGTWQEGYFREALCGWEDQIALVTTTCANNSVSRNVWYAYDLPRLASRVCPDVVHLGYPAPVKRARFGVPLVATIHDMYPFDQPGNFGFPHVMFNRMFLTQCVKESDALVCVSKCTRERLTHYFPQQATRKYVSTIYSYSDLETVSPTQTPNVPLKNFILAVGQHRKNKNLELLLRTYHKLSCSKTLNPDIGMIIAGTTGPESEKLYALVEELGLDERVLFYSGLGDSELAWFYRNCNLFVAPSSAEGFCLPLLEAMQLSRRIVCSDIPVFREIADKYCEFFSLDGPVIDNLARAITRALLVEQPRLGCKSRLFARRDARRLYEKLYAQVIRARWAR